MAADKNLIQFDADREPSAAGENIDFDGAPA